MHGLGGLAVGHDSVASVVVVGRSVNAAVIRPPFVKKVRVSVSWVTEATPTSSVSSSSSVEPAFVTVAAGGVTGQGVTAGVAGVLSLTLWTTRGQNQTHSEVTNERMRWGDDESDLRVSVWRVFSWDVLSG